MTELFTVVVEQEKVTPGSIRFMEIEKDRQGQWAKVPQTHGKIITQYVRKIAFNGKTPPVRMKVTFEEIA